MRNKLLLQKGYLLPIFYTLVLMLSVFSVNAQTISTQPTGFSECVGGVQVLRVVATTATTGTTLVYQWQRSTDSLTWANITGATATSYTPPSAAAGSVFYRVVVRGSSSTANSVTSAAAKVVVVADPRIATQPRGYSQAVGSAPIALTVAATGGTPSLVYQWQSSPNGTTWTNIAGATAATYTPLATVTTTMYYRVIVSAAGSGCGSVTSASATVIKTANVSISTQPVGFSACIGSTQALAVAASAGTSSVIYQWQSSRDSITWTNVSGATTASYRPVSTAAGVTFYRVAVRVLNSNSINSNAVKVNIVADPAITTQPTGYNVTMGATATALRVVATGGTPSLVYQWQSATAAAGPWANITGATAATYTPSVSAVGIKYYRVTVSAAGNGCGTVTSSTAVVVVNVALGITTQPVGFVQCIGGTQALRVSTNAPTGTTVIYQWQSSRDSITWANITGATTLSYMPPSTTAGTNYFRVIVRASTSTATAVTSGMAKVVIVADPAITTQPVGFVQVAGGTPRTLSVVATGGTPSLAYQWQSSATAAGTFVNISGATAATYTPSNTLTTAMYYRVVVSATGSGCGSATSNAVAVTPSLGDIRITTQPVGFSECLGGTEALRVAASGTNATSVLNYQWQKSSDSLTWTNIAGATAATYTPTSTAAGIVRYRVVIRIAGSTVSVTSASVLVSIVADPAITRQPAGYSLVAGDTTRPLTVVATGGTPNLTYQWQSSTTAAGPFVNVTGATSATYRPSAATTTMMYRVVVTAAGSGCGIVTSNITTVSVVTPITITVQLGNITECIGGTQALNAVTSVGTGTVLVYQWQKAVDSLTWTNIAGATSSTYIPSSAAAGTTRYRVVVSAANSTTSQVISNVSTVVILPSATITTQPIGYTYTTGTTPRALSVVVANASANTSYQWQVATTAAGGFTNIAGATTATYMPIDFATTRYYRVVVAGCGTVTSNVAAILVQAQPTTTITITRQPASANICLNRNTLLSVSATASSANTILAYQWQKSADSTTWVNIAGATSASYDASATTAGVSYYRVVVSAAGSAATVTSAIARVSVTANNLVIVREPQSYSVPAGTSTFAPLTIVATSSDSTSRISYQWESATNGGPYTALAGASSASYTPVGLSATTSYRIIVSSFNSQGCGTSVNLSATITITQPTTLAITAQPIGFSECVGGNGVLRVLTNAAATTATVAYQWQKSSDNTTWSNIAGATAASYLPPSSVIGTTYYRVIASLSSSAATSVTSASATVKVEPALSITTQPVGYTLSGTPTPLTIVATGGTPTLMYQWQSATTDVGPYVDIVGANAASYTPSVNITATTYYRVLVSASGSGCGSAVSNVAVIRLSNTNTTLAITAQPIGFAECIGGTQVLNVAASGGTSTASLVYQWQRTTDSVTWTNISGATLASYTPPSITAGVTFYRASVRVTGGTSIAISTPARVSIVADPAIRTQPIGFTQAIGGIRTLSVVATGGTPSLAYQWQVSSMSGGTFSNIPNATTATYTPSSTVAGTAFYRVVVSASGNGCGTATSSIAEVTTTLVNADFIIITQPTSFAQCVGGAQALMVVVNGTTTGTTSTTIRYQWQKSTDSLTWTNITTGTNQYYIPDASTAGVTLYRVVITNTAGVSLTSNPARISIIADPVITAQPLGFTECVGGIQALRVAASGGTPTLNYQWQKSVDSINWVNITAAIEPSYTPISTAFGTTYYRVIISANGNGCNFTTSRPATVVVNNCNITSGFAGQNAGLAIDARVEDNAVKINWYSNTSDKNDYYEVQKLKNTGDFETIDVVNETHNDQLSHTYNFTDKFPTEGENVYRVKLTYQDGNSIASVNQTVVFNKTNADIAVYPNPADAEFWLNIKDTENTNVTISVLDRLGRIIEVKNLDKNHDTKVYFDTQNWQDGQYFILVQPEGKTQITKRVLIQK